MAKAIFNNNQKVRKIPILISKWWDGDVKGWRAEIANNWEDFKPIELDKINFEDLSHHFEHGIETHEKDFLVFYTRQAAVAAANEVVKSHLKNKAKIWH